MRKKSVAVLDIRSSEITAVVGGRGVNGTFIIKSKYSSDYDGYAEGDFIDEASFFTAVNDVIKSTLSSARGIKKFYVGVPGEFLKVVNTDKVLSFQSSKRILKSDLETLADLSAPSAIEGYSVIRHSCLYYVLSDKRKIINPVGAVSDSLQGKFCFYFCKNEFVNLILKVFKKYSGIVDIVLLPTIHAEAMYLIEPEQRDEYAVLFDLGYISSSYSVVCGNGILFSESFSVGIGHVAVYLMMELDIPYDVAMAYLSMVNLNAKENVNSMEECVYDGKTYKFSTAVLRDRIREGLDGICETIEECRQSFSGKNLEGKPVKITGEGVKNIRGTVEHMSNRLVNNVEVIAPAVPYFDKPQFSSVLSLLEIAIRDEQSTSFFTK